MAEKVIHECDFIKITAEANSFYIESFKQGFSLEQFNKIISQHPQIRVANFTTIKSAIVFAPKPREKFGELKDRIAIEITNDNMKAFLILCVPEEELGYSSREKLKQQVYEKLKSLGIISGIKDSALVGSIQNEKNILIAEGAQPENGKDCVINLYQIKEAKPQVSEGGSVDHYEFSLINRVKKDEWVGERIEATQGVDGKNIKGVDIPAIPGKNTLLDYDKNSIYEINENNQIALYSMFDGAVDFKSGKLTVSKHLEISNNVDFSTGNIDFDGCVTIKGTIDDNFMVVANGDIEILGELGIGNIRGIESRKGSIFIKGGISSKNKVIIKAAKNVFVKYVANASIMAGEMIHVGYYSINADLTAKEVLVDSSKGQIIGGAVTADVRVVANTIGCPSEKRTLINVRGINKTKLIDRIEEINKLIVPAKVQQVQLKKDFASAVDKKISVRDIEKIRDDMEKLNQYIKALEEEKKVLGGYLKIHGEGEIMVQRKIHPNCFLEIKDCIKEIKLAQSGVTFYVSNGELKEV